MDRLSGQALRTKGGAPPPRAGRRKPSSPRRGRPEWAGPHLRGQSNAFTPEGLFVARPAIKINSVEAGRSHEPDSRKTIAQTKITERQCGGRLSPPRMPHSCQAGRDRPAGLVEPAPSPRQAPLSESTTFRPARRRPNCRSPTYESRPQGPPRIGSRQQDVNPTRLQGHAHGRRRPSWVQPLNPVALSLPSR